MLSPQFLKPSLCAQDIELGFLTKHSFQPHHCCGFCKVSRPFLAHSHVMLVLLRSLRGAYRSYDLHVCDSLVIACLC